MLSIIIITKNEEKYLPRLLESIKRQRGYTDYEVIVADAHSTDRTRKIAKKYGCKVIDGGLPSIGRNRGARKAKGDLLLFLDSDTALPPGFLKENIKEFHNRKLVCATTIYKPISERNTDKFLYNSYNVLAIGLQYFLPLAGGLCILCAKEIYDRVGGFDEKRTMCEDHFFVNQAHKHGKFRILKSVPILCDVRRMDKEGRLGLVIKYVRVALHLLLNRWSYECPVDYVLHGGVNVTKVKSR